jgi:sugar phosphate permease
LLAWQERVLLTGWRLVSAVVGLSIDQLVAWGVLYYAYTVLSAPIALDLGLSRLQVAAAFSMCLLVSGWVSRVMGPTVDARGTRSTLRAGALLGPLVFAAISLAGNLVSLCAAFVLLGVVQGLSLYEPAFRSIVDWCPNARTRSRAMLGLTTIGGFASAVFLPFTNWLLTHLGWRETVLVLAAVLALVLVPMRLLLPLPNRGDGRSPTSESVVPSSVARLAIGLSLHALASTGVFLYLMWHLVERGESVTHAAAVAGFAGAAQVPGRMLAAPLRRLAGGRSILPLLLGVQAVALMGVVLAPSVAANLCVFVFGAASGMMTLERSTLLVEWYGRATFGSHQGRIAAATGLARALAPFIVEAAHVIASYAIVFGLLSAVLGLGAWVCRSALALRVQETDSFVRSG